MDCLHRLVHRRHRGGAGGGGGTGLARQRLGLRGRFGAFRRAIGHARGDREPAARDRPDDPPGRENGEPADERSREREPHERLAGVGFDGVRAAHIVGGAAVRGFPHQVDARRAGVEPLAGADDGPFLKHAVAGEKTTAATSRNRPSPRLRVRVVFPGGHGQTAAGRGASGTLRSPPVRAR